MVLTVYFGSKAQLTLNFLSLIGFSALRVKDLQGYQCKSSTDVYGIFVMLWLQLIWPHLAWYDRWQNLCYLHFYLDKKKGSEITLTSSTSSHSLHVRITGLCEPHRAVWALTEMFTDSQVKLGLCWGLWGNFPHYPSTGSVLLTLMIWGTSMPIIY